MTKALAGLILFLGACPLPCAEPLELRSPAGALAAKFWLDSDGAPRYKIERDGRVVLGDSKLGLWRTDADFSRALKFVKAEDAVEVRDDYEVVNSKRRVNHYRAIRRVFHLQAEHGEKMDIIFQASDDGLAFRYYFPEKSGKTFKITAEASSFHLGKGAKAWLQPCAPSKSGWSQTNPSYEENYEKGVAAGVAAPLGAGWVFPALFHTGHDWVLLSEGSLASNYCGSRLSSFSPHGEYSIAFPDPREHFLGGPVNPESSLPWLTPWRIVVTGDLKTVVESNLGLDLAQAPPDGAKSAEMGMASWSWPLLGDGSANFETQKQFIDYAASMGWGYTLVDALWDRQIGYEKVGELVQYGAAKKVKILLWYNSAGNWNSAYQTPRNLMLTRESRRAEFKRLKALGVAGLKVDFFGGDGQSVIGYYRDILNDAAEFGFAMNFHGATLPRGWQREFPNLMTMEAVRGLEMVTFWQGNADEEPAHACMLPFTRNLFDPMDFTPMVLDGIKNITRRTTPAFELALSVLFTSGIQHYAEIPAGMGKAPDYVRAFLKGLPSAWDDLKFLGGFPGKYVVLARRSGKRWWVAGINGENSKRTVKLDLAKAGLGEMLEFITDGGKDSLAFKRVAPKNAGGRALNLTLAPHGGFVIVAEP